MSSKTLVKNIISKLHHHRLVELKLNNCRITCQLSSASNILSIKAVVYEGENYIPPSVRECISKSFLTPSSSLNATLSVVEETYEIVLGLSEQIYPLTEEFFLHFLQEFNWLSEEWRRILDDYGERDLLPVKVK